MVYSAEVQSDIEPDPRRGLAAAVGCAAEGTDLANCDRAGETVASDIQTERLRKGQLQRQIEATAPSSHRCRRFAAAQFQGSLDRRVDSGRPRGLARGVPVFLIKWR